VVTHRKITTPGGIAQKIIQEVKCQMLRISAQIITISQKIVENFVYFAKVCIFAVSEIILALILLKHK